MGGIWNPNDSSSDPSVWTPAAFSSANAVHSADSIGLLYSTDELLVNQTNADDSLAIRKTTLQQLADKVSEVSGNAADLESLFAAVTALIQSGTITITAGTDGSGNLTATFAVADPLTIGTLDVTTLFKGKGRTDGVLPATGYIGEQLSATRDSSTPQTMTPSAGVTPVTLIIGLTLTPGIWMVTGNTVINPNGASVSAASSMVNTSTSLPADGYISTNVRTNTVPSSNMRIPTPSRVFAVSTNTGVGVYSTCVCTSAVLGYGFIQATRIA